MAIVVIEVEDVIDTQVEEMQVEEGYTAGEIAPAGTYEDLETHRLVYMPHAGILPAACDGHVAVYMQKSPTWGEMVVERRAKQEKGMIDMGRTRPKLRFADPPEPALSVVKKTARSSTKKKLLAA